MYVFVLWIFEKYKNVPKWRIKCFTIYMDKFIYYGHSCFMVETNGINLLFDPFITPNELAANINITDINPDYILISHGHSDHIFDAITIAKQSDATVICSWEIHEWLNKQGITKTHPMNVGGKWKFDFGSVKMTFAAHSSGLPDGSYGGVAAGFLVQTANKTIYYSGDTGLNAEMKLIGELNKIDVCILPIGDNFTMDYVDACTAAGFLYCNNIIGVHYDTFGFIKINHKDAKDHFNQHGRKLTLVNIGEIINL
jgi:L-ascorbate metabolism protein UlaG (beta-lactamase superfamily)